MNHKLNQIKLLISKRNYYLCILFHKINSPNSPKIFRIYVVLKIFQSSNVYSITFAFVPYNIKESEKTIYKKHINLMIVLKKWKDKLIWKNLYNFSLSSSKEAVGMGRWC